MRADTVEHTFGRAQESQGGAIRKLRGNWPLEQVERQVELEEVRELAQLGWDCACELIALQDEHVEIRQVTELWRNRAIDRVVIQVPEWMGRGEQVEKKAPSINVGCDR